MSLMKFLGAVGHADDGDERGDEPPTKLMFRKNVHSRAYNKEKMHNSREALTSKLRRMLPVPLVLLLCERLRHKVFLRIEW